jgi:hypothetical protein
LASKRTQQSETRPDFLPEKAYSILKTQLAKLPALKGRNYEDAKSAEDEWFQLTEKFVLRSFGSESRNYSNFRRGRSAGEHFARGYGDPVPHARYQRNFEARQQAYEVALRSCIAELELDLPDTGIKGVYEPGEQYEFYRGVTACLKLAQTEIFIIDPYLDGEIFDVYAEAVKRAVKFRLLSAKIPTSVQVLAKKYAAGGNLAFRSSASIHDRVLFADHRVWASGQSLKDAARKKPTYIVELDGPSMRKIYEPIWDSAVPLI